MNRKDLKDNNVRDVMLFLLKNDEMILYKC